MAKGKRLAKKVEIYELEEHIRNIVDADQNSDDYEDIESLDIPRLVNSQKQLEKDLKKIEFDFENYDTDDTDDELLGFNTIDDFTFLGVTAGGDWEFPIFFIIYLDTKNKLRAYIPTDGNVYNKKMKSAFGNYEEEDIEYLNSIAPIGSVVWDEKNYYPGGINEYFDFELLKKDILNRIEVQP